MRIILASGSKRRQELLEKIGLKFEVMISENQEIFDSNLSPLENCSNVSLEKAREILKKTDGNRIIVSCDTIVCLDNKIYGKPKDREDAYLMLKEFSGKTHEVLSCLTVIKVKDNQEEIYRDYGKCLVTIDNLSDKEIYDWIDSNNPYDKAGAYAIQEDFSKYVSKTEGDFYSIVGFPLNKFYNILKKIDN